MSRDYAKKSRPKGAAATSSRPAPRRAKAAKKPERSKKASPRKQSGGLSLRWILSLALVGGFIGFIAYLNSLPTQGNGPAGSSQRNKPAQTATTTPKAKPAQKEKKESFQFYEMLPESEVVPPKVEAYDPGPAPAERNYQYMIQTGSFKGRSDAERQRAQVAFQGLHATVQQIKLDSGVIWYRVNIGPFDSRSKMNSVVDKLVSINIEPLVRKVPKDG
ncbi:sporulation protein [Marinobacter halodurans]|uniref:Sporulation protein n=1 Tax=Marinobacter halodurans TaxID=2528979 RepID=A0ABY1ZM33_9GAMM|nr:SPOR domain-containing protein [Marinobacter halodurans]TBW55875.1 sporulation protein [Marinobacter halodurans]